MPLSVTQSDRRTSTFGAVLCGIDGSRADPEAARQAATLAGLGARLELVSVVSERGTGMTAQATLSRTRARQALRRAHDIAREEGAHPVERLVDDVWDTKALLREAEGFDLLVLGDHHRGRADGIMTGSTASSAVHRPTCPVLIARQPPAGQAFPGLIVLADDGTPASENAARTVEAIAVAHSCSVVIVAPSSARGSARAALAAHAASIELATGTEPAWLDVDRAPGKTLAWLTDSLEAGLLVLGSRRLGGLRALGSVSERAAARASCSVLVVP